MGPMMGFTCWTTPEKRTQLRVRDKNSVPSDLVSTHFLPTNDRPLVSSLLSLKRGIGVREEDIEEDVGVVGSRRAFERCTSLQVNYI